MLAFLVHFQFEAIHPFRDGNGRIGRLLLALTIFEWQKMSLPWLYMSAYFERYKEEYVDNMFRVSTHGDWERWVEYCLRGTAQQAKDTIVRLNDLLRLRTEMHERLDHHPRLAKIIDHIFVSPIFTAIEVAEWGSTSRPTARRDIDVLKQAGYAQYLTGERPRKYYVPRIFAAAYGETIAPGPPEPTASDESEA